MNLIKKLSLTAVLTCIAASASALTVYNHIQLPDNFSPEQSPFINIDFNQGESINNIPFPQGGTPGIQEGTVADGSSISAIYAKFSQDGMEIPVIVGNTCYEYLADSTVNLTLTGYFLPKPYMIIIACNKNIPKK